MYRLRSCFKSSRSFIHLLILLQAFFMAGGAEAVEARQEGVLRAQAENARMARTFGLTPEQWRVDDAQWSLPGWLERSASVVAEEAHEILDHSRMEVERLLDETRQPETPVASMVQVARAVAQDGGPVGQGLSEEAQPKRQIKPYIPRRPALEAGEGERTVAGAPRSAKLLPGLGGSTEDDLPLRVVQRKAQTVDASALPPSQRISSAIAPASPRARGLKANKTIAPEIVALAASLDNSPVKIFRYVHDQITYDPKWGLDSTPLGTLWEGRGTSWDQAWLLQELLTAAGVDARLEWGQVEIPPSLLTNLTGIDDPVRAGDFLTTAGLEVLLVIQGSQVAAARFPHVWVKAYLDYIPNRGATNGTADTWIRMDPSITTHERTDGLRLDQDVPFVLGDHLLSGTELSPRQDYEAALLAHVADQGLPVANFDDAKSLQRQVADTFPFVPGTLRAKIVSAAGESETVPAAFEQDVEVQIREEGGGALLTWTTTASALYGKRLETVWLGATSSDQAALDLYGGIFATPPYEVDLRPTLRLDGVEVASGTSIGSAEDAEIQLTLTPPDSSGAGDGIATVAGWDMFAGEHGVLSLDYGRAPTELADRFAQEALNAAGNNFEEEGWKLAQASSTYLNALGGDLVHLVDLSWHRLLTFNTAVFAVKRGAVSTSPDGTPQTFSPGPLALDVGAMPLAVMPVDGVQTSTVPTLELLGSQGSFREGEALAGVFGGEHLTAVTFLTRAVREGQVVTKVDLSNLDATLADSEISSDAKGAIRYAVEQLGMEAWISETQIESNTFQTTGYILIDPSTGSGGYFLTFERRFTPLDGAVTFHNPIDLDVITAPTDVIASIDAEGIESWTLATASRDGGSSTVIASGTGPLDNAVLGQFDPTLMLNGMHDLVLTGEDAAGQPVTGRVTVVVDGQMKLGRFTLSFSDLAVQLSGLNVEVLRTYDSADKSLGDFGVGWQLAIRQGSYTNNRPPGDGWQFDNGFLPCDSVIESKSHLTTIRLSDFEVYRFGLRIDQGAPTLGGCFGRASFDFIDGPQRGSTLEILDGDEVFYANGSDRVVHPSSQELYVPQQVRLRTRDGRVIDLDLEVGVTRLAEPNGNALTFDDDGIRHSSGVTVDFVRDAEGRIVALQDPAGNDVTYTYDAAGDLRTVTDRVGAVTRFGYDDNHRVIDIEDARGVQAVRNEYDDEGRLVRHIDAAGQVMEFTHDVDGRQQVLTDRNGNSRLLEFDERGNVVRETNPLGQVTQRTFDGRGQLTTSTDALGRVQRFEYSSQGDLLRRVDGNGDATVSTYDASGRPLSTTLPTGEVSNRTYDGDGNLLTTTDPLGNVQTSTYDGQGRLRTVSDPLGRVTTYHYDSQGRTTRVVDGVGNEVRFTYDSVGNRLTRSRDRTLRDGSVETLTTGYEYDAAGRLQAAVDTDGSRLEIGYDPLGNVSRRVDALDRVTTLTYDALGRLASRRFPDGSEESQTYDAEGNLLTSTDRAGRVTRYTYDAAGRQLTAELPDGSIITRVYDMAGQLTSVTAPDGGVTRFAYDAAGRQISVTDALNHVSTVEYDGTGRTARTTDALGQATELTYDAAGRLVETLFADGSSVQTTYDAVGRRRSIRDALGGTTHFAYGPFGHLSQVTDALGQVTTFEHNSRGERLRWTDAGGATTEMDYDGRGRLIWRQLADGAVETWTYLADDSLASHTDANGITSTFSYDLAGRLSEVQQDGESTTFTYTAGGRRATVTDAAGTMTTIYDAMDRPLSVTYPSGHRVLSTYDVMGRRTAWTAEAAGQSFSSQTAYDLLGRPVQVTDVQGETYDLAYDPLGRLTSVGYPNGVTTTQSYDSLGRTTALSTENGSGTPLQRYQYDVSAAGQHLRIAELDGKVRDYTYDALGRLVGEMVHDGGGGLLAARAFDYDSVGNRTQQTVDLGLGQVDTLAYTYDNRHRTVSRLDNGSVSASFTWDADGRLTSTTAPSPDLASQLFWDAEDRLVQGLSADGHGLQVTYDVDGHRVAAVASEPGGASTTTEYVNDTAGDLSHTLVELVDGAVDTVYVRAGDRLLSLWRPADGKRFYHLDALGSVRLLTDASGAVTDRYDYTAFGELEEHVGSHPNTYRFAGEPFVDFLGLAYHRARWLDPSLGRFTSVDPFAGFARSPMTLHPYMYGLGDPVNRVDPSGEFSFGFGVALAVLAVVTVIAAIPVIRLIRQNLPTKVRLRPIIFKGTGWTEADVLLHLQGSQTIFNRQGADLFLEWYEVERIHRPPHQRDISQAEFIDLFQAWHRSRTMPLFFVGSFKSPSGQVDPYLAGLAASPPGCAYGMRGMAVAEVAKSHPLITAHELGHAIGCLADISDEQFLMDGEKEYGKPGGTRLSEQEVQDLQTYAGNIE